MPDYWHPGYLYVNIDDGWQGERDERGILQGNANFPDMKALGDYLHARGLKFGLYSSPGSLTCADREGSLGHEEQDAQTFASWGVDYLKYDLCSYGDWVAQQSHGNPIRAAELAAEAYAKMGDALRHTGRPIVFSISQHGLDNVEQWAPRSGAQLWRTTEDVQDRYERIAAIGFSQDGFAPYAGPNRWNDPDMLVVGNGSLSEDECRTQMSLWAILAAPLLASNDIREMPPNIASILMEPEIIAVDQDTMAREGHRILARGLLEVWERPMSDGSIVVGVFNRDYDLATNPIDAGPIYSCPDGTSTTNLQCLYKSIPAQPPFATMLAQPADWTLGIQYTSSSQVNGAGFLTYPFAIAADSSGNLWVASGASGAANLSELSSTGAPLASVLGNMASSIRALTIDPSGNIWVTSNTGASSLSGLFEYTPDTAKVTQYVTPKAPYAVASDGSGNIFFTVPSSTTLNEFSAGLPSNGTAVTNANVIGTVGAQPYDLAIDTKDTVWVGNASGGTSITEFTTGTGGQNGYNAPVTIGSSTTFYNPYGIAIDASGTVWSDNPLNSKGSPGNTLTEVPVSNAPIVGVAGTIVNTAVGAGGLSKPRFLVIDGAGNLWAGNNTAQTSGQFSVSALTNAEVSLSPAAGYAKPAFDTLSGIAVDPSGNVWVTDGASTDMSVVEIVGAGVPVVTPIALGIKNNALGSKP